MGITSLDDACFSLLGLYTGRINVLAFNTYALWGYLRMVANKLKEGSMKRFTILSMVFSMLYISLAMAQEKNNAPDSLKQKIAQLEKRLQALEEKESENELQKLMEEAQTAAEEKPEEPATKTFKTGQRSLQAINPELSVTGDSRAQAVLNSDGFNADTRNGFDYRVLGLHFQSSLDPFSFIKAVVEFSPDGVELGEVYATWSNLLPNVSVTAGKFRQQFGVVNRWHDHALDQYDYPLAMTTILGGDGLNQTGVSFQWLMPSLWADANTFYLQLTNGANEQLFAGSPFSFPSVLARLTNYYDLSENTYLDVGFTGMTGQNNIRGYDDAGNLLKEANRRTNLAGMDVTLFWEPVNRAHYHSFLWRSELYYADKQLMGDAHIKALGGYSYVEYKINERFQAGVRYDYTQPFLQNNSGAYISQVVPYITWWQSHWARFRLQLNHKNGSGFTQADNVLLLQLTWAAGPHKHDRY